MSDTKKMHQHLQRGICALLWLSILAVSEALQFAKAAEASNSRFSNEKVAVLLYNYEV